jgi:hypothetical protein
LQIFPTDEEKQDDLIDQCHQLLQYTILMESILPEHPLEEFIENLMQVLLEMTHKETTGFPITWTSEGTG